MVFRQVSKTYQQREYQSSCFSGKLRVVIDKADDVYPCEILQYCCNKDFLMENLRDYGLNFKKAL